VPGKDSWQYLQTGRRLRQFKPKVDTDLVHRAVDSARGLAEHLGNRQLQVRKSFVRRAPNRARPPAAVLSSSRSEVTLKLELVLLWISAGTGKNPKYWKPTSRDRRILEDRSHADTPIVEDDEAGRALLLPTDPHVAQFPLRDYAKLLGLPDPKVAGAARIRRSLDELATRRLIWLDRTNGASPRTQLRREDGSDADYKLPGKKERATANSTASPKAEGNYFSLPATFFTNGWAATLTARGVSAFLALLVQSDFDPDRPAFISPSIREDWFGLWADSFLRGAGELAYYQIVRHHTAPVQREWSTSREHVRHAFVPQLDALTQDPTTLLASPRSSGLR